MDLSKSFKKPEPLVIGENKPENKWIKFFNFFHPILKAYNGNVSGGGALFNFKIGKEKLK